MGTGWKLAHDARAVLELVPGHAQRGFENALHVDRAHRGLRRAREDLEVADDVAQPFGGLQGVAQFFLELDAILFAARVELEGRDAFDGHVQVGENGGERVVDLVRHARGQDAHRGHAVGHHELLLQPAVLGDVEDGGQVAEAAAVLVDDGMERQHAPQGGAVLAAQAALGAEGRRAVGLAVQVAGDGLDDLGSARKCSKSALPVSAGSSPSMSAMRRFM
jgi:hypothetical protein